jgi:hypothetical protein
MAAELKSSVFEDRPGGSAKQVYELALKVAQALQYLALNAEREGFYEKAQPDAVYALHIATVETFPAFQVRNRKIEVRTWNPYARFQDDLAGADAGRIRVCRQCGRLFYAVRADHRGRPVRGCSQACNRALRQAQWRENEQKKAKRRRQVRTALSAEFASSSPSVGASVGANRGLRCNCAVFRRRV